MSTGSWVCVICEGPSAGDICQSCEAGLWAWEEFLDDEAES